MFNGKTLSKSTLGSKDTGGTKQFLGWHRGPNCWRVWPGSNYAGCFWARVHLTALAAVVSSWSIACS